jgi:predicted RNA-binding Zn ribbon-like protein
MIIEDSQFEFIGNNLAVDFTNTEIVSGGTLTEMLRSNTDLVQWAQEAGFPIKRRLNPGDLSDALTLRWALKEAFESRIDERPAKRKALTIINQHLAHHGTHTVLQVSQSGRDYELVPHEACSTVTALLATLAYEGAQLLASSQADRLKRCGNANCVLIFVDTSRTQKRRWCSMETCGNRAKAAKHYRKHVSG